MTEQLTQEPRVEVPAILCPALSGAELPDELIKDLLAIGVTDAGARQPFESTKPLNLLGTSAPFLQALSARAL